MKGDDENIKEQSRFSTLEAWLTWQDALHWSEIDLELTRIRQVANNMALLDLPYKIMMVAGTNGKGSSIAMLEAILLAQGYKTGAYTSPHINRYNERIKLSGIEVNDGLLCDAFDAIDRARKDISLTSFEFSTLAALWIFKQHNIDVAVLEVGMGGRLDAVNVCDADVALITSIDLDHTQWLGETREAIGREKAGIMRAAVPAISGEPNAPDSIAATATQLGATLYQVDKDFSYHWDAQDDVWLWQGWHGDRLILPVPALSGAFQLANAANVVAVLKSMSSQLKVSQRAIQQGLQTVNLAGRLEQVRTQPDILLDATHNPHAAKQLCHWLRENPVAGKTLCLFSMLKDKEIAQVVNTLQDDIDHWFIVPLDDVDARGLSVDDLQQRMQVQVDSIEASSVILSLTACESIDEAWQNSKKSLNQQDRLIVFGSFLLLSKFNVILSE